MPPEEHWPYEIERYEEEPAAFHYAYADDFRALNYARLDPHGMPPEEILTTVKRTIYAGYAVVFGFTVFSSLTTHSPDIAFPDSNDSVRGGHAVMAVGYDDHHAVNGQTVPSLVIRNSWGGLGIWRLWLAALRLSALWIGAGFLVLFQVGLG